MDLLYAYAAEITKADRQPDGTLMVYGKATGPDLDLDGQRCDPAWLKNAMPEWFKWGNIREQHGPIAAGVGVELEERGSDWYVKAHIVDPGTVAKVENKVLKGFSIGVKGGRVVKTAQVPKGIINGGDVVEVSLVDRPANPTCGISIAKSAGGSDLFPVGDDGEIVPLSFDDHGGLFDEDEPTDEPLLDDDEADDAQPVGDGVDKAAEGDEGDEGDEGADIEKKFDPLQPRDDHGRWHGLKSMSEQMMEEMDASLARTSKPGAGFGAAHGAVGPTEVQKGMRLMFRGQHPVEVLEKPRRTRDKQGWVFRVRREDIGISGTMRLNDAERAALAAPKKAKGMTKAAEGGEAETVGDLRKGFIMDLLHGKNDQKRDHGKFAPGSHKRGDEKARARIERMRQRAQRAKDNAREDATHAEALRDADRARLAGREGEAADHLAVAAAHSRTPGHYRNVRRIQGETANAMRGKGVEADIVKAFESEIDELLGEAPDVRLSAGEYRDALTLLKSIDDDMITKRHDEQADIDGANTVIAQLADLIVSEATELKNGCLEEAQDIAILLEAIRGVCRFIAREQRQDKPDYEGAAAYEFAVEGDLFKRFFSADERRDAADEGAAMSDGSFPIKSAGDLKNAIHLAGNAKDPAAARAHIVKRAKALGLSDQIPDTWKAAGAQENDGATVVDADEITKAVTKATESLQAQLATAQRQMAEVMNMPRPGAPFVMPMPSTPAAIPAKAATTDPAYWRGEAAKIADPSVKGVYLAKAEELEGATR